MTTTRTTRRSMGLAAALALTTTLAACGGTADGGPDGDGDVTLQMVESLTNPDRTELLREILDDFEAQHEGVRVELVSPPTEQADQTLQQMLQAGSGVDVLEVRDLTVGSFANNGWLYDIGDDLSDWEGWDALTENARNASQLAGGTYFLPYGFYGISLFYRTDLVEEAGFDGPPESWTDLHEQASAIQDPAENTYGYAFRGGANGFQNAVLAISAYVAERIDTENAYRLEDGSSIFSAPEALDGLEVYFALFEDASPPSAVAWGYPEMVEGFSNGSTAFLLQDPEVISAVQGSSVIGEDQWTTAPMPVGPTGQAIQPLATAGWGVAESSQHKDAAVDLVAFLAKGEASATFSQENSLVPILQEAAEDDFYRTGAWESYVTMTENPETYITAVQPRDASWWTEWSEKADNEVQQVLTGSLTPEELLESWDSYWTEKWDAE